MNSSDRILAQRYAAAYDALSQTAQEARGHYQDLLAAQQALVSARAFMQDPKVSSAQKTALIKDVLKDTPKTANFVALLLDAKRYGLLDEIVAQVSHLLDVREGITRAVVASAAELDEALKLQTKQAIEARFGGKAEISYQVDPSLIGGLKIWCGGELLDGSLLGRFTKLQEELTK